MRVQSFFLNCRRQLIKQEEIKRKLAEVKKQAKMAARKDWHVSVMLRCSRDFVTLGRQVQDSRGAA